MVMIVLDEVDESFLLFILRFDLLEFFLLFDGVEIFEVEDFL
jgi:hypothetical protein